MELLGITRTSDIFYLSSARFPTEKAYGYQVFKECETLTDAGASVSLVSPALAPKQARAMHVTEGFDVHRYFGVRANFEHIPLRAVRWIDPAWTQTSQLWPVVKALGFAAAVRSFLKEQDPGCGSIVWTQDLLLAISLSGGRRSCARRVVYECHGVPMRALRRLLPGLRACLAIIATTGGIRDYLIASGLEKHKILVVPNAVDLARFQIGLSRSECRRRVGLPLDRMIIGYIGKFRTYEIEKGIPELIAAMGLLGKGLERPPLLLCVGGPLDRVEQYLALGSASGVDVDSMMFVDFRPRDEIVLWMRACDVCTIPFPETVEHFARFASPMKAFEYMAAGVPIVATDIPSLAEILADGQTAVLVEPSNPDAMAAGLRRILLDSEFAEGLVTRAFEGVRVNSWEARAQRMLDFVRSKSTGEVDPH
ncbi:MAG: hypothetical protein A2Z30_07020 [Chloroflexi bacterium RBG_16_64_43]|nr:MAG: hypothetical protein A2Z30_07020 [Chloroflexi bacterium RBG_16_64_43]